MGFTLAIWTATLSTVSALFRSKSKLNRPLGMVLEILAFFVSTLALGIPVILAQQALLKRELDTKAREWHGGPVLALSSTSSYQQLGSWPSRIAPDAPGAGAQVRVRFLDANLVSNTVVCPHWFHDPLLSIRFRFQTTPRSPKCIVPKAAPIPIFRRLDNPRLHWVRCKYVIKFELFLIPNVAVGVAFLPDEPGWCPRFASAPWTLTWVRPAAHRFAKDTSDT